MIRLILLTDFTEAFAHNLLRGILNYSKGREPWVVCRMPPSYKQNNSIIGVLEWAKKWDANAIIAQFDDGDDVDLFKQNGIVAVAQDFKSRFTNIPNITSDYELTGKMAADFLIQKGFRHFAFYGYKDVVWSEERCIGFKNRIQEKGFENNYYEYKKQDLKNLWYYEQKPLIDWIKSLPHPVALMACDDTCGNKIMEVCQVIGVKIPEEVAVLGVDNDEIICSLSNPPMSSVNTNIEKGGYEAAALIDKLIKNNNTPIQDVYIQPVNIVNRSSTDIFATDNPSLLKALRYIHQNLTEQIMVDDIVRQVPMSRRLLEIKFKEATGQSIHQYIFYQKMENFSQYLLTSNDAIADIAFNAGFHNCKNISRQFKLYKGSTPEEYRKANKMK